MRRLMAAVAATALLTATGAAAAEDWQPADYTGDMIVGVDVSSIESDDRFRGATVMFVYARTSPDGADFMLVSTGFDCVAHTVAVLMEIHFTADGDLLSTVGDGKNGPDDPIRPGSLFQSIERMVCQGQRNPAGISDGLDFAARARRLLLDGGAR